MIGQFVSESELEAIVKRVRRSKQKNRDEAEWNYFLKSHQKYIQEENESCHIQCTGKHNKNCIDCKQLSREYLDPQKEISRREECEVKQEIISASSLEPPCSNDIVSHTYQLGPGLTKRLQDLLSTLGKMTSELLSPAPSTQFEDEDVDRTIKRSLEFDAMFARNHLYEIQRLLKDTKQLSNAKPADLEVKVSAALKSVTQALQVYTRHVSKGSRVKYQQVIPIFQNITTLHALLEKLTGQRSFPLRKEIEVSCSYAKQILLEISVTESKSISTVSHKPVKRQKHKPSADLSMYSRRQKAEWRRKSANLALTKFGPPNKLTKKCLRKTESAITKEETLENQLTKGNSNQMQSKELVNAKEVPFRNATRAVPEEQVITMMEMIPHENLHRTECEDSATNRPLSAKSSTRNAKLVYLKEKVNCSAVQDSKEADEKCITLTMSDLVRPEMLEYHQQVADYQKSSPHYKDGKAVSIVDRLANHILTEMLMDFQQDEMNQVVQTLYNLEFE